MWDLTQQVVDQRWEALIRPLARRRRVRRAVGRVLTSLLVVALVVATWIVGSSVLSYVMHVPRFGLRS